MTEKFDGQICSTGFCVLRVNEALLDPVFLYYYLLTEEVTNRVEALQKGATYPAISDSDLFSQAILLPPLPEQRAIARALRAVQAAREARVQELALERERKAALMEYLFTHGTRGEPTKQTEIGEMPESWEVHKLSDICNIRYGLGQPPELDDYGVPMIRATDIKSGKIVSDSVLRVRREAIPKNRNPFLNRGDILVVRSGAYTGDLAMYDGRWEAAIAGYDLVVSPNTSDIDPEFIAYILLGNRVQSYFRSQRDRSAQPHLNSDQLSNTLIPLPTDISEQIKISISLNACDSKNAAMDNEVRLLDELFRAMLEELMAGRLSATPLIEESAQKAVA